MMSAICRKGDAAWPPRHPSSQDFLEIRYSIGSKDASGPWCSYPRRAASWRVVGVTTKR